MVSRFFKVMPWIFSSENRWVYISRSPPRRAGTTRNVVSKNESLAFRGPNRL
jgi:hypothetical protein